ncbi:MAG: hypothetical protein CM15mP58_08840 [Burkholderiaceae bacterium]|nr:MAG: hypothetical protein CM15mP58_08840 [Burkholderiaceae bacterium]
MGLNARASLITRGMAETVRLGVCVRGGKRYLFRVSRCWGFVSDDYRRVIEKPEIWEKEIASGVELKEVLSNLGQGR